jgi:hypothetical protein
LHSPEHKNEVPDAADSRAAKGTAFYLTLVARTPRAFSQLLGYRAKASGPGVSAFEHGLLAEKGAMPVRFSVRCAALSVAFLLSRSNSLAYAQATESVPGITVEAQRQAKQLKHDVNEFAAAAITKQFNASFLRWDHPVCPLVAGLNHEQGEFVLHRLSDIARSVHVPLGKETCKPNFFVIVAQNPSVFIQLMWRRWPRLFDTRHGIAPVRRFIELPRPVRIWYNQADIDADAGVAFNDALAESAGVGLGAGEFPIHVRPSLGSRLTTAVVRNIETTMIVVDPEKVKALNFGQLVDYIALIGFAQINLDKDLGQAPSILKVFSAAERSPPIEMTDWDRALLRALYSTPQRDLLQLSEMETAMFKEISVRAAH